MTTVAIAEFKASFTKYLERVRAGEEVLVTEQGAPVARLVPVCETRWGRHLQSLIDSGEASPPKEPLTKEFIASLPLIKDGPKGVLDALLEERENGR